MKTISNFVTLLGLSALAVAPLIRADEPPTTPPAGEQGGADRAKMREHRMHMMDEKLQLTDAQKQQIKTIRSASEAQMKALRADTSLSEEDRRDKRREIMKASHDQIRTLLTPDQQKTFDAMPPPEMRGRHGPKGNGDKSAADAPPKP